MSLSHEELTTSDGISLAYQRYLPDADPKAIVIGLHGIQSHAGWYRASSAQLAAAGIAVYFADRRGAGRNSVARGHADAGMRLLHDVRHVYDRAAAEWPGCPIMLMGLSWGAKIAAAFCALHLRPVHRLLLLYPGLRPAITPNRWQRFLLWFAKTHDLRHRPVRIPLSDPALFTDDLQARQMISTDPLALHTVTSGFLNAGRELDRILKSSRLILPPALTMLAGRDRIINNQATEQLLKQLRFQSLTVERYPQARHTLEFEPDRERIINDLIGWLQSQQ